MSSFITDVWMAPWIPALSLSRWLQQYLSFHKAEWDVVAAPLRRKGGKKIPGMSGIHLKPLGGKMAKKKTHILSDCRHRLMVKHLCPDRGGWYCLSTGWVVIESVDENENSVNHRLCRCEYVFWDLWNQCRGTLMNLTAIQTRIILNGVPFWQRPASTFVQNCGCLFPETATEMKMPDW